MMVSMLWATDVGITLVICLVERAGHGSRSHSLHEKGDTEDVESLVDQGLNGRGVSEGVVLPQLTGNGTAAEFGTRFVGTKP
jgi:hypothetical protein